jgi:hypothetical protein
VERLALFPLVPEQGASLRAAPLANLPADELATSLGLDRLHALMTRAALRAFVAENDCARFSRAYVHHLIRAGEILALRLLSFHNLHFLLRLATGAREAITAGNYPKFKDSFIRRYNQSANP